MPGANQHVTSTEGLTWEGRVAHVTRWMLGFGFDGLIDPGATVGALRRYGPPQTGLTYTEDGVDLPLGHPKWERSDNGGIIGIKRDRDGLARLWDLELLCEHRQNHK